MINSVYQHRISPTTDCAGRIVDVLAASKAQLEELQLEHIENMEDLISTSMAALIATNEFWGCEFKGTCFLKLGVPALHPER
jgi:hypothetical protein